jgi:methionine synthase I (cobalamin-dependent)
MTKESNIFKIYIYAALHCVFTVIHFLSLGVPAVITLVPYIPDMTTDDVPIPEACRRLEEAGAAVVGLNCGRGPRTMLPLIKEVRKACKVQ